MIKTLNFKEVDYDRYPAVKLAIYAGTIGGSMPTVFNASNEVAVDAFIKGKIKFLDIENIIEKTLIAHTNIDNPSLEEVLMVDKWARDKACELIEKGEIY